MNTLDTLTEFHSSSTAGGDGLVPQAVTLRRSANSGEWATHRKNMKTGETWYGHYFICDPMRGGELGAHTRAVRDYVRRCRELGVNPFPEVANVAQVAAGARVGGAL